MNENGTLDSVVKKEDFPEKEARLQELLSTYTTQNNVPNVSERTSLLTKVKVKKEVGTRQFSQLSDEEKRKVAERIKGIDYCKSADILNFGSAKGSPLTKQAEEIISKYSAKDLGEIADPMTDLVATLKANNPLGAVKNITSSAPSESQQKEWGLVSSIKEMFSMKKAKKKLLKALAGHESIKKNIQAIEVELRKQQLDLQKDVTTYEEMGNSSLTQVTEFEYDSIALDLMISDAKETLEKLTEKGELDLTELNKARTLESAIDRMERRKMTIETIRVSVIQSVPELSVLMLGDEIICEKIDEVETLVIPMWTWQYAIAIGALKQKEALSIQKTIRGITSKLLTGNAKMLHDNMIAAQEELYATAVAVEDLLVVQQYIDDMVTTVDEKKKEAAQKSVQSMKVLKAIEQKNYELMSPKDGEK